jgi:gliding motility-associated-like protein
VCLIASIPFGCADTFCLPVTNQFLADFGIYNVFTPGNDDALNTSYDIVIDGENYYHLQIYDRWGIKVFESFNDDEGNGNNNWNGKVNNSGAECPGGTYYYLFEYGLETEKERKAISGVITLIR